MRKRVTSILLALCMVVSLLPVATLATEEAAQITGFSVTVDGVTYTEGNVSIKPDSTIIYTVTGTNLDKLTSEYRIEHAPSVESGIGYGFGWDLDTSNTTATRDFSDRNSQFLLCDNFQIRYRYASGEYVYTGIYLTYDDGSTEADKAEITGLSLVVDGVTYTEGHVNIGPEDEVIINVHGNYMRKADENHIVDTPGVYVYVERMCLISNNLFTQTAVGTWFEGAVDYPITYTNDAWATTIDSGITVTYETVETGPAAITGLAINVDGVTYTEGNVIIRPDSEVSFTVFGENLTNVNQKQIIDTPLAYLPLHSIPLQDDGTYLYATYASVFAGGVNYNISYTNDAWATTVATDIFVTYQEPHSCEYGDWIISKQPTFTSAGEQYRVCSVCGDTETEALDMLVGEVTFWNIVLKDDFAVKFYLQVSQSIESTAAVQLTIGKTTKTYPVANLSKNADGYYLLSAEVAAAQMNDSITVTVHNGTDTGTTATYSVRQYCDTILADDTHSQYHALVQEMLNYGAMAQIYFKRNVNNLANTGITDVAKAEVPETTEAYTICDNLSGLDIRSASLVCRSRIAIQYVFAGDVTGLTFTANGNTYTPIANGATHYIEIPDILPQDLDQQIILTVTDTVGNTLTISYSPMNYIVRKNTESDADLKNLLKALYNYHLAAKGF